MEKFKNDLICDQSNKLSIGRSIIVRIDLDSEKLVDLLQAILLPTNLNCMTDRALHLAGCGLVSLGHCRIDFLCDCTHPIGVFDNQLDSFSQKGIALNIAGIPNVKKILEILSSIFFLSAISFF